MALTSELSSIARNALPKMVEDAIHTRSPGLDFMWKTCGEYRGDGLPPDVLLRYAQPTASAVSDFGLLNVGHEQLHTRIRFSDYAKYQVPIVVTENERKRMTGGRDSAVNIMTEKLAAARDSMRKKLSQDFYIGMASTELASPRQMIGLDNTIQLSNAYGGIDVGQTAWWFMAHTVDTTSTLADGVCKLIEEKMTTLKDYDATPDIALTTGAVWNAAHSELTGRERVIVTGEKIGNYVTGSSGILVRGVPLFHDPDATAKHLYLLTSSSWTFLYTDKEKIRVKDFQSPTNQDVLIGHALAECFLVCKNLRENAVFTGLE